MAEEKKSLNVPPLRFPGFTDEWERVRLGDLCEVQMCKRIMATQTNPDNGVPFYKIGTIGNNADAYISQELFEEYRAKYNFPRKGEVMITCAGTVGKCIRYDGRDSYYQDSNIVWLRNNSSMLDNGFLFHVLTNVDWTRLNSTTIVRIYNDDLRNLRFSLPPLSEQKKIVESLNRIDERIATQNKIIEDLKALRISLTDKMFCSPLHQFPAKRMPGFEDDWLLMELGEMCQRLTKKNQGSECNHVLTIAAQYGLVCQEDFFNKSVASANVENYYWLEKGDFAYNKSYSGDYTWGAVKRLEKYAKGILSPLYICFRPKSEIVDSDYLTHYFESKKWHRGIADIAGEGARNHGLLNISVVDFFKTKHRIPSINEQRTIAGLFNSIKEKIELEQSTLDCFLTQKKYLLQKMFV